MFTAVATLSEASETMFTAVATSSEPSEAMFTAVATSSEASEAMFTAVATSDGEAGMVPRCLMTIATVAKIATVQS